MAVTTKNKKGIYKLKIMTQTFILKKGQISFDEDRILISDNGKRQKYLILPLKVFWILFGIINIRRFYREGDQFFYFFWCVLVVIMLLTIVVIMLSRSTKSLILLDEVKSIKVKQLISYKTLDIKLKNNRLRRVIQIEEGDALKEYIEKQLENLIRK